MTEGEIFGKMFELAQTTPANRGVVVACLVRDGTIIACNASDDVTHRHAEDLLLEKLTHEKVIVQPLDVLYVTLEPCGERTQGGGGEQHGDCATKITSSALKHVVYAAVYPHEPSKAEGRFKRAGIAAQQFGDSKIVEQARRIFNERMTDKDYIRKKGKKVFL